MLQVVIDRRSGVFDVQQTPVRKLSIATPICLHAPRIAVGHSCPCRNGITDHAKMGNVIG
jgi:hypothetical protein